MRKVLYIFGQLSDADVTWLARAGTRRHVADGDVLIREGEVNAAIYILLDGRFRVSAAGVGVLAVLGAGELVGEMSFVDSTPPSATVAADGPCQVLAVDKARIRDKIAEDQGFGLRFYKALSIFLADRLRGTVRRLGYGDSGRLDGDEVMADELDEAVLDGVSLAGERFDRMLKVLMG